MFRISVTLLHSNTDSRYALMSKISAIALVSNLGDTVVYDDGFITSVHVVDMPYSHMHTHIHITHYCNSITVYVSV